MDNNQHNKYPFIDDAQDLIDTEWHWYFHGDMSWRKDVIALDKANADSQRQEWYLVPENYSRSKQQSSPLKATSPSKETPLLYKMFTDLPSTMEAFLKFANQYGTLVNPDILIFREDLTQRTVGERYTFWITQHCLLQNISRIWEWTQNDTNDTLMPLQIKKSNSGFYDVILGDPQDLNSLSNDKVIQVNKTLRLIISFPFVGEYRLYHNKQSDQRFWIIKLSHVGKQSFTSYDNNMTPQELALLIVGRFVNNQLQSYPINAQVYYDYKKRSFMTKFVPSSLLSAMWLQFSQVITGEKKIRQCPICHRWSDVTNIKGSWIKHRDCANWDGVTKFRKMPEIVRLLNVGKTLKEISDQLNIDTRHIERWLAEKEVKVKVGETHDKHR